MYNINKTIWVKGQFRITETPDNIYNMADLKGDCFNPEFNPDIDPVQLRDEEHRFERDIYEKGVNGYLFEKWNPEVGHGWETIGSCFGFIGDYCAETNSHYIVDEFIDQIENGRL
jgi:hypothetical protein